jgi:hypothetical protein
LTRKPIAMRGDLSFDTIVQCNTASAAARP